MQYSKEDQLKRNIIDVQQFRDVHDDWYSFQLACEELLQYYPHLAKIRIPDSVYNFLFSPVSPLDIKDKRKAAEWIRGLPDVILLKKRDKTLCDALCVEWKHGRKPRLRQSQKHFADHVPLHVARSLEDFNELIEKFDRGEL